MFSLLLAFRWSYDFRFILLRLPVAVHPEQVRTDKSAERRASEDLAAVPEVARSSHTKTMHRT